VLPTAAKSSNSGTLQLVSFKSSQRFQKHMIQFCPRRLSRGLGGELASHTNNSTPSHGTATEAAEQPLRSGNAGDRTLHRTPALFFGETGLDDDGN
jgi:hypothetical protein